MAAGCSDGMAHNIRFIRSPPASLSVCERHARQPRRAEKGVFEEGDAEVLFRKTTPIAARTPHLLPSLCYGRQVVSSRVQAETRQNSPQHQSSPRRLIKRTAEKQVWRTVMAGATHCFAGDRLRQEASAWQERPPSRTDASHGEPATAVTRRRPAFVRLRRGKHACHYRFISPP